MAIMRPYTTPPASPTDEEPIGPVPRDLVMELLLAPTRECVCTLAKNDNCIIQTPSCSPHEFGHCRHTHACLLPQVQVVEQTSAKRNARGLRARLLQRLYTQHCHRERPVGDCYANSLQMSSNVHVLERMSIALDSPTSWECICHGSFIFCFCVCA